MPAAELDIAPLVWMALESEWDFAPRFLILVLGTYQSTLDCPFSRSLGIARVVLGGFGKWAMPNTAFPNFLSS